MSEVQRLRDRVEELERVLGVDESLTSRLRTVFGLEPGQSEVLGMLMKRNFVTHDSLYTVLYGGRPECDWPEEKIMDVQICKLRRKLKKHGVEVKTRWGEGWWMPAAEKSKVRAALDLPAADHLASAALADRRHAFLNGS